MVNSGPSSAASRRTSVVRPLRKSSRRAIAPANENETGRREPGPTSSAVPSVSCTSRSRRSASTSSRTYSGLPTAWATCRRSRGPSAPPASRAASSAASSGVSGPRLTATASASAVTSSRSAATSGRTGTGRLAPISSSGSWATARCSRPQTARLASSAHCMSSTTTTTGDAAHSRSTSASSRSATAATTSPGVSPAAPSPRSRAAIWARSASGERGPMRRQSDSTHSGNRCRASSADSQNRVDLPMPGSPSTHTDRPRPATTSVTRRCSCFSARSRPTSAPDGSVDLIPTP